MLLQELKRAGSRDTKKNIKYIYDLASETGVDVSQWDASEVFGESLLVPIQEINKKFFAHTRRLERKTKIELTEDFKALTEGVGQFFRQRPSDNLLLNRTTAQNNIDNYQANINVEAKKLLQIEEDIANFESFKPEFSPIVREILREGFWTLDFVRFEKPRAETDTLIEFLSDEIVLQEPHDDGRDFKLSFGRLRIRIRCDGLVVAAPTDAQDKAKVFCYARGMEGFFHPFVRPNGEFCFGTGASAIANHLSKRNYGDAFLIAQRVLTTYPGGTPFASLKHFFMEGKDRTGERPWLWNIPKPLADKYGLNDDQIRTTNPTFEDGFRCPNPSCSSDPWSRPSSQMICANCETELPPPVVTTN